jgi:uncharacterized membrane protein
VDPTAFQAELVHVGHRVGWGLLASAAMAVGAWKVRALTIGGAVISMLLGAAIFSFGGFEAWLMYLAAATVAVTSWRVGQKKRGPTPASHGVGSAIASCAIGLIGAWLMAAIDANATGALILTTGVAAWASDAMAGEFEKGYGKGAGALASLLTSIAIAGLFALTFRDMLRLAPFIVLGVTVAWLIRRTLASPLERSGLGNEDVLLFLNTLVAAAITYGGFLAS